MPDTIIDVLVRSGIIGGNLFLGYLLLCALLYALDAIELRRRKASGLRQFPGFQNHYRGP